MSMRSLNIVHETFHCMYFTIPAIPRTLLQSSYSWVMAVALQLPPLQRQSFRLSISIAILSRRYEIEMCNYEPCLSWPLNSNFVARSISLSRQFTSVGCKNLTTARTTIPICSEVDVTNRFAPLHYQCYCKSHHHRQSRRQSCTRDRDPHNRNSKALQTRIRGSIPPVKALFL